MRKRAGYLTKKKGGYGPKDTQSIVENNSKITKLAVCKKSKQFLSSCVKFDIVAWRHRVAEL